MDLNFPDPNPALSELFVSETMRRICEERATTACMLYTAEVAKRTGRLAATAHPSTEIGGVKHDRWIGVVEVGGVGPSGMVGYAASHEFGHWNHDYRHPGEWTYVDGAHDLNHVLAQLASS